jgi:predicted Zn finger-like uncharacterized protein
MSLITRCPACRTMFKVVPDQLRISGGWVRCGQCDEVFDASTNLQDPLVAQTPEPQAIDIELEVPQQAQADEPPLAPERQAPTDMASVPLEPVLGAFPDWEPASSSPGVESGEQAEVLEPALLSEPSELLAPSFMRTDETERAETAMSRWQRFGWLLATLLLSLAMVMQLLVHERDRIAATAPGFKPLVQAVCALMQCSVAPLHQIESVLIDSASFNKARADVYRLSLTLKNAAKIDVALPAIELSLTDAQDQALMRRVFLAGELGLSSEVLVAGSESTVALSLDIKTNGNTERIAGYRVLAFYP